MSVDEVRYERVGAGALVTIDRQHRRNAIDGPTAERLRECFTRFEEDADARALVLTGAGEAFCAGADLKAVGTIDVEHDGGPLGFTRLTPSKPTIAAVGGWCLAGGLELAAWCDLRIASRGATFGCTERRFGVPLIDGGTQRLPRIVGMGRALDLILTGRLLGAEEAQAMGLVTEVVADGGHVDRALDIAQMLSAYPQETLISDRLATLGGAGMALDEGLELERQLGQEVLGVAAQGAARFAAGEGRHGEGAPRGPRR